MVSLLGFELPLTSTKQFQRHLIIRQLITRTRFKAPPPLIGLRSTPPSYSYLNNAGGWPCESKTTT